MAARRQADEPRGTGPTSGNLGGLPGELIAPAVARAPQPAAWTLRPALRLRVTVWAVTREPDDSRAGCEWNARASTPEITGGTGLFTVTETILLAPEIPAALNAMAASVCGPRSEEHTSELQSLRH